MYKMQKCVYSSSKYNIYIFVYICHIEHRNITQSVCACKKVRELEKEECMCLCVCKLLSALVPFNTNITVFSLYLR